MRLSCVVRMLCFFSLQSPPSMLMAPASDELGVAKAAKSTKMRARQRVHQVEPRDSIGRLVQSRIRTPVHLNLVPNRTSCSEVLGRGRRGGGRQTHRRTRTQTRHSDGGQRSAHVPKCCPGFGRETCSQTHVQAPRSFQPNKRRRSRLAEGEAGCLRGDEALHPSSASRVVYDEEAQGLL